MPGSEIDSTVVGGEHRTARAEPDDAPMPERIGRYTVSEMLGRGGMGVVYRARDPKLDRDVAVKVVASRARRESKEIRNRALREAQALARLTHPNVVRVYDVGIDHGALYIAMELLGGRTLAEDRRADRPWREVLAAYQRAGEALAAAHAQGLVHRDFKPHNVMRTETGEIKVLDFGLARLVNGGESSGSLEPDTRMSDSGTPSASAFDLALTTTGACLGTPAYMAPEQFGVQAQVGPAADQFSFCVALWEALYGERPFTGSTLIELRQQVVDGRIGDPPQSEVPAAVAKVLRIGLRADPDARHRDMRALLRALQSAQSGSRLLGALLLSAAAFAVGMTVLSATQPEEPCTGGAAALQSTWDDARRDAIGAAVLASERAYAASTWERLQPRLDAWAQQWIDSHTAICRAGRAEEQSDPLVFDRRMACLERARVRMSAFVDVLGEGGDEAVRRAIATAASLPEPRDCVELSEAQIVASRPPAVQKQLDLLRRRLDAAQAKAQLGEVGAALETALAVRAEARELGDEGLAIDAMLLEADERGGRGERHAAEATLREAYLAAVELDDADRAAKAARALVFVTGIDDADYPEALEWARHAEAQLERLTTPDPVGEAALLGNLGAVLGNMGKLEESTRTQLRALTLERSALGDDDLRLLNTFGNVATAMMNQERFEEARHYAERAVELAERNLGEDHPDNIEALQIQARVLLGSGDHDAALTVLKRAHDIAVGGYGGAHLHAARTQHALANANLAAGNAETAVGELRDALAVYRTQLGEHHPDRGDALNDLARALYELDRPDEAIEASREALAIEEHLGGPDHPNVAHLAGNLATALRSVGKVDEAIGLYQRAIAILEATPDATNANTPTHYVNLALALHDAERWHDADEAYAEAIEKLEASPSRNRAKYLDALSARGEVLLELGRTAEAFELQRKAQASVLEQPPAPDDPVMRRTYAYILMRGARLTAASAKGSVAALKTARSSTETALETFESLDDDDGVAAARALLNELGD